MRQTIGIIADDLTGANDSGVQIAKHGYSTSVLFKIPETTEPLDDAVVIDTNARVLEKNAATNIVKKASEYIKTCNYTHIYKKIDSTLRGHIGAEIEAMDDVFHPDFIIIAPAFPAYGRATINGVHYVNGVELAKTEVNADPTHPVKHSNIKQLLNQDLTAEIGSIYLDDIQNNQVTDKLTTYYNEKIRYIICDAKTEADLEHIVAATTSITKNIIWVGAAGLAAALAKHIESTTTKEAENAKDAPRHVITVCGSVSDISQKQVAFAGKQNGITAIKVDTPSIFTEKWPDVKTTYVQQITDAFSNKQDVILYAPADKAIMDAFQQIRAETSLSNNDIAQDISHALGDIILDISQAYKGQLSYVLTGGDTAKSISMTLGATGVKLIQEIEAGIPSGKLIGTNEAQAIVTKAGGFGQEDSLYKAILSLKEEK